METVELRRLVTAYPVMDSLPDRSRERLRREATFVSAAEGAPLLRDRDACPHLVLPVEGALRIVKRIAEDREMVLYRVRPGEICVLSVSTLLADDRFPAGAVVDQALTALAIPRALFLDLVGESAAFREFVFTAFSRRLAEMMHLVEAVAVQRLDRRLAGLLLEKGETVRTTHQQLADELGSVREIISRILKGFESDGLVRLGRGELAVLDPAGLRRIAGSDPV